MIPAIAILIIAAAYVAVCLTNHGYANTVDQLAYWLHQHAKHTRAMHAARARLVASRWVRELESAEVKILDMPKGYRSWKEVPTE